MNLGTPSPSYNQRDQAALRSALITEDARNLKRDVNVTFSGDSTDGGPMLILKASDGSLWRLVVDTSGTLTTVAA